MGVFTDSESESEETKPVHGNTRNWSHYRNLRRTNPRKYYSTKTQRQIIADRQRLGQEAFYGGANGDD